MKTLIKRFSEPSTYAGLAGLAMLLGATQQEFQAWTNAIAGVFAIIAVALGEGAAQ